MEQGSAGFRMGWPPLLLFLAAAVPLTAEVPPRTLAGQTLEVGQELLDQGNVYFLSTGRDSQLTIVSEAPLSRSVVTATRAIGFVVAPWEVESAGPGMSPPLLAGAFRIPVHGLRLGHEFGESQLWGPALLDKQQYPDITFEILGTESVRGVRAEEEDLRFEVNLKGRLTCKDRQLELVVPVQMTFFPSSIRTMARHVGDMLSLQTSLNLNLQDLGLSRRGLEDLLAEEVEVQVFLMLNTISPDRSLNPQADPEMHRKQLHFVTLLRDLGQEDEAYAYGFRLMQEVWEDPVQLHRLAGAVIRTEGVTTRRLGFALKAAQRAAEVGGKDADLLALLGEIHFRAGRPDRAVKMQEEALDLVRQPQPRRDAMEATLKRYRTALEQLP